MKTAIVHDWLTGMRGGEKCLEVFCEMFPAADLYTLVHIPEKMSDKINKMNIKTSLLQKMPLIDKTYRCYLPLMPKIIENFDLKGYDLVLSSSHCVAKGIRFESSAKHICYCYTPMRYIWDLYDDYFAESSIIQKMLMKLFLRYLRTWDKNTTKKVNVFFSISNHIKDRIKRIYGRQSEVIYPPVDTEKYHYGPEDKRKDYYLLAGAFAAYKKMDLVVDAFSMTEYKLLVIGSGQEFRKVKSKAGKNITFLGWVDDNDLRNYYAAARALIFPSNEDFGIVPVEAMACGTPVIAYRGGGALETVVEGRTGVFFDKQSVDSLLDALENAKNYEFSREIIREHALKFSREKFKRNIENAIKENLAKEKLNRF